MTGFVEKNTDKLSYKSLFIIFLNVKVYKSYKLLTVLKTTVCDLGMLGMARTENTLVDRAREPGIRHTYLIMFYYV